MRGPRTDAELHGRSIFYPLSSAAVRALVPIQLSITIGQSRYSIRGLSAGPGPQKHCSTGRSCAAPIEFPGHLWTLYANSEKSRQGFAGLPMMLLWAVAAPSCYGPGAVRLLAAIAARCHQGVSAKILYSPQKD
jgi:hypothetical protein